MKHKKIFVFICIILLSPVFALDWQSARVIRTIDTEYALLTSGKVIKLIGFDGPDHLFPSIKERGIARRTYHLLKLIFKTQNIKILLDTVDKNNNIYPRHVKLETGENLVELLLKKGFGLFKSDGKNMHFDTKFQKAEALARQNKIGIWDKSMRQKSNDILIQTAGVMTREWKKKFAHLLAPISIGRVISVKSGNTLILENGACIRLIGIETPSPIDTRRGHQCFGKQSQMYLAELVLGKKVELIQDNSQLDNKRCILRHVWIPNNPKTVGKPQHINKKMIENGFGKVSFTEIDKKYKKEFLALQEGVYKDPRGAWLNCATEVLAPKQTKAPSVDKDCPIKISKSGKAHTPKSGWYKRLTPVQCFQNEEEARKSGFEI